MIHDPYVQANLIEAAGPYRSIPDFQAVLPETDILTVHLPLGPESRGLIGSAELAALPQHAFVINAARGGIIDESSLYDALSSEKIAGAGLDVFDQEPPPADHPLFTLDNVILSPHNAGLSKEAAIRMAISTARNALAALDGNHVRATWMLAIPSPYGAGGPPEPRVLREQLERSLDLTQIPLRLIAAPSPVRMVPDLAKIGLRLRREDVGHLPVGGPPGFDESIEIERLRGPALLAFDQRAAQRLEPRLLLFQQLQRHSHDLACRAVAALCDLPIDEPDEALVEGDRGALRHHEPPCRRIPPRPQCW
jgi:hypothetical protein